MSILTELFLNLILVFYKIFFHNLGLAMVMLTIFVNFLLFPLNKRNLEMAKKQQALKPKLDELKKRFANDKQKLLQEQSKLFKQAGINPAAGCLPAIIQLVLLIVLINAFASVLKANGDIINRLNDIAYFSFLKIETLNTQFLFFDLTKRDVISLPSTINFLNIAIKEIPGVLVITAAVVQFFSAKMMLPSVKKAEAVAKKTETSSDDISMEMQKQMLYLFPLLYLWFGTKYPSGLALYFLVSSLFSVLRLKLSSDTLILKNVYAKFRRNQQSS